MKRRLSKDAMYQEFIKGRWLEHHGYRFNAEQLIDELVAAGYGHRTERGFQFDAVEPKPVELNNMIRDFGLIAARNFHSEYLGLPSRQERLKTGLNLATGCLLLAIPAAYLHFLGFFEFMHRILSKVW